MVTSIGVVSFFLGSILRAAQKDEDFKRNTQLTVYTNKKAAAVSISNLNSIQIKKKYAQLSSFLFIEAIR